MSKEFEFDFLIKKMATEHQPELPSAGLIWWRAQILKKQAEKDRIERPYKIMRVVAAIICVAMLVGLWLSEAENIRAISENMLFILLSAGTVICLLLVGLLWQTRNA